MFFRKYYEIFQNTYFEKYLQTAASETHLINKYQTIYKTSVVQKYAFREILRFLQKFILKVRLSPSKKILLFTSLKAL